MGQFADGVQVASNAEDPGPPLLEEFHQAWQEAIGVIIDKNMEARAKNPHPYRSRGRGRGRG